VKSGQQSKVAITLKTIVRTSSRGVYIFAFISANWGGKKWARFRYDFKVCHSQYFLYFVLFSWLQWAAARNVTDMNTPRRRLNNCAVKMR